MALTSLGNHELVFRRRKFASKCVQDDSFAAHQLHPAAFESGCDVLIVLMGLREMIKVLEIFARDLLAVDLGLEKLHEVHVALDRFDEHVVDEVAALEAVLDVDQGAEEVIELGSVVLFEHIIERAFPFKVKEEGEPLSLPCVCRANRGLLEELSQLAFRLTGPVVDQVLVVVVEVGHRDASQLVVIKLHLSSPQAGHKKFVPD